MALEQAFDDALKSLRTSGGLVTVVLGTGVDAPSEWSWHPRVHWLVAGNVRPEHVENAVPPNTRLMLFTENIDSDVFHPLHDVRKRRRLPYMVRKTGDAVATELKSIFRDVPAPPVDAPTSPLDPPLSTDEPSNGDAPKKSRGFLREFLEANANLSTTISGAEEARRLFKLAQSQGVETTIGSLQQGLRMLKRARSLGDRPQSVVVPHVRDSLAATETLDHAIKALTTIRARVEALDTECAALRRENDDLKMRIGLMKEAFAGL